MRRLFRRPAPTVLGLLTLGVLATLTAGAAIAQGSGERPVSRVVMFASDGMRPDLMEKYAAAGAMPTYKKLMRDGVTGDNGMVQAFPPNTGVGWYTMATGTYPSEHGSTNNTYFRSGDTFSNRTSFSAAGTLQADTIANAAERAGKKVAQVDWVGGATAGINGPDGRLHELLLEPRRAGRRRERDRAGGLGVLRRHLPGGDLRPGERLDERPAGDPAAPPKETTLDDQLHVRRAEPEPHLRGLLLRQRRQRRPSKYDHAIVSPVAQGRRWRRRSR